MATKTRDQNPTIGDTVQLNLFVLNSNNAADLDSVSQVDIYYLDPELVSIANPDGRTLVESIPGGIVTNPAQGQYLLELDLSGYTDVGLYMDRWVVTYLAGDLPATIEQQFEVYQELWYTSPLPIVYDFSFAFRPNRLVYGNKVKLEIEIIANVPRATDLQQYYYNLAIAGSLRIFVSQNCGDCLPPEQDLRLLVDGAAVPIVEKNRAWYFLDTTTLDCGLFDVWFELTFGENTYVSPASQLLIYV